MKMDYDNLAREYALHRQVRPGVLASLLKTSALNATSSVLEVGCGTGNYIIAIQEAIGCACHGIDPSEEMLTRARGRSSQVRFATGRAEKLDFESAAYDLIFSVDVIHHIEDRAVFYREAFRLLKPGGKVCTATDSEDIIRRRQPLANYFPETVEPEIARYPRIADLRRMMEQAGFGSIIEERVEHQFATNNIQAYRDKAFSSLYLISTEAFNRGIQQMEADLKTGPIQVVSRYLLLWVVKP
jgi:ubiquinone/menaquinone biosynthesis C-methylase UbiE